MKTRSAKKMPMPDGSKRMTKTTMEVEFQELLSEDADHHTIKGRADIVRNAYMPELEM